MSNSGPDTSSAQQQGESLPTAHTDQKPDESEEKAVSVKAIQILDQEITTIPPANITALMRRPFIAQTVLEGAKRSVSTYCSSAMSTIQMERRQKAYAGGREEHWIKQTTGEEEDALLARLKPIPAPQVYSCGEINLAMGDKLASPSGNPTLHIVKGLSVNYLHETPLGQDSVLMVASQFDFQEAMGPYDSSVSEYILDQTQGPQAQIETLWASLHRKAAKHATTLKHALTDLLPEHLLSKYPGLYKHGYLDLNAIKEQADKESLFAHIKANIESIKILPQWAICEASGTLLLQVFCAAPFFLGNETPERGSIVDKICHLMVVAQYVATAQLAVIRSRETSQAVPLHLTMVGQGAFNNRPEIMGEAMRQVAAVINGENVQVFVHAYSKEDVAKLTRVLDEASVTYDLMSADSFSVLPKLKANGSLAASSALEVRRSDLPIPLSQEEEWLSATLFTVWANAASSSATENASSAKALPARSLKTKESPDGEGISRGKIRL